MIRRNTQNRKMKINLHCPNCGMLLTDKKTEGFVLDAQTYCCKGCAEGKGCTCREVRMPRSKGGNRRGDIGQRNPENSPRDRNFNQEVSTSGETLGVRAEKLRAAKARSVPPPASPPVAAVNSSSAEITAREWIASLKQEPRAASPPINALDLLVGRDSHRAHFPGIFRARRSLAPPC
jgi:hypothetical protein